MEILSAGSIWVLLLQWMAISLSGVMMPGAITTATVNAGCRRRWAGSWVAVGHGLIELPLLLGLFAGLGVLLANNSVRAWISLLGGLVMLILAGLAVKEWKRTGGESSGGMVGSPLWLGVILTASNSFFLLWWATVGLSRIFAVQELGVLVCSMFAILHWFCDWIWLTLLSWLSYKGARLSGGRFEKKVTLLCGLAMAIFGLRFVYESIHLFGGQ